jgi:hypothetical protein
LIAKGSQLNLRQNNLRSFFARFLTSPHFRYCARHVCPRQNLPISSFLSPVLNRRHSVRQSRSRQVVHFQQYMYVVQLCWSSALSENSTFIQCKLTAVQVYTSVSECITGCTCTCYLYYILLLYPPVRVQYLKHELLYTAQTCIEPCLASQSNTLFKATISLKESKRYLP